MRYLLAIPVSAILIGLFNIIAGAGAMMDPESLAYEAVLPSAAEFYLKLGDVLTAAAILSLAAVAWRAMKCPSIAPLTAVVSAIVVAVAIFEFLFVGYCGSATFFFLMLVAVSELLIAAAAWARRAA